MKTKILDGVEIGKNEPRFDLPVTSWTEENAAKTKTLIKSDRRLMVR